MITKLVKCPTCDKQVEWSDKSQWRPFCSQRCQLIDLGEWASESHRIAGQENLPEELIDAELTKKND